MPDKMNELNLPERSPPMPGKETSILKTEHEKRSARHPAGQNHRVKQAR